MRYIPAIAVIAALTLTASAALAATKHHPRYARHVRAPVAAPVPYPSFGPPYIQPRAFVPPGTCIQDEGYGRWTYCGQGRS
jgi:hypothetical protein